MNSPSLREGTFFSWEGGGGGGGGGGGAGEFWYFFSNYSVIPPLRFYKKNF